MATAAERSCASHGAEQAVAGLKAMIEKAERPIRRQRGQPERKARELDRPSG